MSDARVRPDDSVDDVTEATTGEIRRMPAEEAVAALCRGMSRVLGASPRQPARVRLDHGGSSLEVEWDQRGSATAAVPDGSEDPAEQGNAAERFVITSPLVGVFYGAQDPDAQPFVSVGDLVERGQQVALVEAMKLFNAITSDRAGRVVEISVRNGEAVEYGQELVVLELGEEE